MAIIRTKIIKLGVSFGSGCIKFGNDELAYVDALRAFPQDETYRAFRDACDSIDAEALAGAGDAGTDENAAGTGEGVTETGAENAEADGAREEDTAASIQGARAKAMSGAGGETAADAGDAGGETPALIPFEIAPDDEEDAEEEAGPEPDPTVEAAIEAAKAFRETCSRLAFSEMYEQMGSIIGSLEQGILPPVADLAKLDSDYTALVEYVSHH